MFGVENALAVDPRQVHAVNVRIFIYMRRTDEFRIIGGTEWRIPTTQYVTAGASGWEKISNCIPSYICNETYEIVCSYIALAMFTAGLRPE